MVYIVVVYRRQQKWDAHQLNQKSSTKYSLISPKRNSAELTKIQSMYFLNTLIIQSMDFIIWTILITDSILIHVTVGGQILYV